LAGVDKVLVDFSHVAIFRALITHANISGEVEGVLFSALQAKDVGALTDLVADLDAVTRDALLALPQLHGEVDTVLQAAQQRLPQYAEIKLALQDIKRAAHSITDMGVELGVDLAELRGYHYHTGMVFAAYSAGCAGSLAQGGRYDQIGQTFGRARPATGFSLDLRALMILSPSLELVQGILAPYLDDAALQQKIATLRTAGEVVIVDLPGHEQQRAELNCDRMLVNNQTGWEVVPAAIYKKT
jgi:ATP phosphoribosyltransferase regulatory subunit